MNKKEKIKIVIVSFVKASYVIVGLIVALFLIDIYKYLCESNIIDKYNMIHAFGMLFIIIMFSYNIMMWYRRRLDRLFWRPNDAS